MNSLRNTPISIAHLLRTEGLRNQNNSPKEKGIAHSRAQIPFSIGASIAQIDCAFAHRRNSKNMTADLDSRRPVLRQILTRDAN